MSIITYLRTGKIPVFNAKMDEVKFNDEMEFWNIPFETTRGNDLIEEQSFDPEWCAKTLTLQENNKIVTKESSNHGIVFCKLPLDHIHSYVEFKISIEIPSRTKSHLFIGVVNKSKYKPEFLTSSFWKDSPCSYYWDIWNTKIIKMNEDKIQTANGYGCPCEEYETVIGIHYDSKRRNISFYKNGYLIGIAFKDVDPGYIPSLDLWFESGTIELLSNDKPIPKEFL